MNDYPDFSKWLTPQTATLITSDITAILLAKGVITTGLANAVYSNTSLIGAIAIALIMNALFMLGSISHNLRSLPSLPTGAMPDSVSPSAPSGPASPSYGPPSTGPETTAALPAELAGVV